MKTLPLRIFLVSLQLAQVFNALGIIGGIILLPCAQSIVQSGSGSVAFFTRQGAPGFNVSSEAKGWELLSALNLGAEGSLRFNSRENLPVYGRLTVGTFLINPGVPSVKQPAAPYPQGTGNLSGTITVDGKEATDGILRAIRAPFAACLIVSGLLAIAVLELIRRIAGSVGESAVFSTKTLSLVHATAWTFIGSFFLKLAAAAWLQHAMVEAVLLHVPLNGATLATPAAADWTALLTGVIVLGLAKVFRHGLELREENSLTI